jgi:hypothetical protein
MNVQAQVWYNPISLLLVDNNDIFVSCLLTHQLFSTDKILSTLDKKSRIILKWILKKYNVSTGTEIIWLRIRASGEIL